MNKALQKKFDVIMAERTIVCEAIAVSNDDSNPVLAKRIREDCNYTASMGIAGGYYDGPLAWAASNFLRWRLAACDSGCAGPGAFGSSSFGRDPEDVPWSSSSAMPNPSAIAQVATPAPRPQCAEARRSGQSSC